MASFTFNQANGTTLETIDAVWDGDTSFFEVQSSALQCTTTGGTTRRVWYPNSQPLRQSSRATFKAASATANTTRMVGVQSTTGQAGYEAFVYSTYIEIRRNGTYKTDQVHGVNLATTDLDVEVRTTDGTGGRALVSVYTQGSGSPLVTWQEDVSDLTGGFPSMAFNNDLAATEIRVSTWTDGEVSGGVALDLLQTRRRTFYVPTRVVVT